MRFEKPMKGKPNKARRRAASLLLWTLFLLAVSFYSAHARVLSQLVSEEQ